MADQNSWWYQSPTSFNDQLGQSQVGAYTGYGNQLSNALSSAGRGGGGGMQNGGPGDYYSAYSGMPTGGGHSVSQNGWSGSGGMGGMGGAPSAYNPYSFNDPSFTRGYQAMQQAQQFQTNRNNQMAMGLSAQKQQQDLGYQQQRMNTITSPLLSQIFGGMGGLYKSAQSSFGGAGGGGMSTNFGASVNPLSSGMSNLPPAYSATA